MKCMVGWHCMFLGIFNGYGGHSILLCVAGVFIGAIAEGVIMRYL
jgi:hypothetical protein